MTCSSARVRRITSAATLARVPGQAGCGHGLSGSPKAVPGGESLSGSGAVYGRAGQTSIQPPVSGPAGGTDSRIDRYCPLLGLRARRCEKREPTKHLAHISQRLCSIVITEVCLYIETFVRLPRHQCASFAIKIRLEKSKTVKKQMLLFLKVLWIPAVLFS